jgi:uncharacterized protein YjiS (DUF1127 family)
MTGFTEMEKAMVDRATMPVPSASVDGFARIAAFGRAIAAHWRHAARKHQVQQELALLNERMLADIGLTRGDVETIAELTAQAYAPVERPVMAEIGSFLRDMLVRPILRWARRRRAYQNLMALDDRILRDIGLTRDEIPALVRSLSGEAPAWTVGGAEAEVSSIRLWNRYRAAAKELSQLDNHMLADIGFVRGDIDWVAEELAVRSLRPAANHNTTPRAA